MMNCTTPRHLSRIKVGNNDNRKTDIDMKKNIFLLLILATLFGSCGFEDEIISFGTTSMYFYNQEYNRNIVVGEGLQLKAGVMFSGLIVNDKDRFVQFVIDPSLVTDP